MKKLISILSIMACALGLTACAKLDGLIVTAGDISQPQTPEENVTPTEPIPAPTEEITETPVVETEPPIVETEPVIEETEPAATEEVVEETEAQEEPTPTEAPEEQVPETDLPEIDVSHIELPVEATSPYTTDGEIVYTNNWVNVRTKPSMNGEVITQLEAGEEVFRYEQVNGWSKIEYSRGKIGYIYNKYIDTERTEEFTLYTPVDETVYAGYDVNMRTKPGGAILGKLREGKSVRRIGIGKDGWSQCIYKNELVYINSTYLSTDPAFDIPVEYFLQYQNEQTTPEVTTPETVPTETEPTT